MRIEKLQEISHVSSSIVDRVSGNENFPVDSIEMGRSLSPVFGRVRMVMRKVSNFFRRIFARFLPIKAYTSISAKRIEHAKSVDGAKTTYQIVVDGYKTNNLVTYTKEGEALVLSQAALVDGEMKEHMAPLLAHVLKEEKASGFTTNCFAFAKILKNAGYLPKGVKIRYFTGSDNPNQQVLGDLINTAKERNKQGKLDLDGQQALERIEADVKARDLFGEFADLATSMVAKPKVRPAHLSLEDVLLLQEGLGIEKMRGITFNAKGKEAPLFTK